MLDYQKNVHADTLARELSRVPPAFLSMFGLELLFDLEGCRTALLHILKVYVERSMFSEDVTINFLFQSQEKRKILSDYIQKVALKNDEFNDSR